MTAAATLTVAQALVRFLGAQEVERDGVSHPFFAGCLGILGHGNVAGLGQALQQERGALRFHQARNEQAMVHIATAFARQSNRMGAFACTTSVGPGATNLVTGAALATINRLPVLLLPGDVFASRRSDPVLQQLERPDDGTVSVNDCLRPVSRYFDRVERPEQIFDAALEAMRSLTDPADAGAVTLALPQDVQVEALRVPASFLARRTWSIDRRRPDPGQLDRVVRMIAEARRPLIVAGGGVVYSEACDALRELVDLTGIPVGETQAGRGALAGSHPLALGGVGATGTSAAAEIAAEADLVIGLGTRWTDFTTASRSAFQCPEVRFVNVNLSRLDVTKMGALPIQADVRETLIELGARLGGIGISPKWREQVASARSAWLGERERIVADTDREPPAQPAVIAAVNEAAADDGTVVCAAGSLPGELHRLWQAAGPNAYHVEYGYSCMGYEVPAGIGVKLADPSREVIVMVGDGSWLMLNSEIVTAVSLGLRITVVLVDNGGYASIGALSRSLGQGGFGTILARDAAAEPEDPPAPAPEPLPVDLAANAESLGAAVIRAETVGELREALATARATDGPVVIHVRVDRYASAPAYGWWDVPVAEVSSSPAVRLARQRHAGSRSMQRDLPSAP